MGYEISNDGKIVFHNIDGFKEDFKKKKIVKDFNYFFTKMWGERLEDLMGIYNGEEIYVYREGKYWYDDEKAMNFLSKYATGEIKFFGEDDTDWKYILDGKGNAERINRERF